MQFHLQFHIFLLKWTIHPHFQPLFIYLSYQAVHSPLQAPDVYVEINDKFVVKNRRTYAGNGENYIDYFALLSFLKHILRFLNISYSILCQLFLFLDESFTCGQITSFTQEFLWYSKLYNSLSLGMVTCMDEGVGEVVNAMKQRGLWDDTILIFSTGTSLLWNT